MKPLYHGTIYDFEEIDVSAGKGYKDFGKGFYATAVPSHAERLAIRNKSIAEKRQSFLKNKKGIKIQLIVAYRYNLLFSEETAGLKVKVFEKADKDWLRFILQNRKCNGCMHDYDIVIGPVADDGVVYQLNLYMQRLITLDDLVRELTYRHLNNQYFFGTESAILTLKRV